MLYAQRPITENPRNEVLIIEVWDFDAAETVKEKVNKLMEVKGIKGLRKLMKEIAMTASTGKHDNELIGRTAITLKVSVKKLCKNRFNPIIMFNSFSSQYPDQEPRFGTIWKKETKQKVVDLFWSL